MFVLSVLFGTSAVLKKPKSLSQVMITNGLTERRNWGYLVLLQRRHESSKTLRCVCDAVASDIDPNGLGLLSRSNIESNVICRNVTMFLNKPCFPFFGRRRKQVGNVLCALIVQTLAKPRVGRPDGWLGETIVSIVISMVAGRKILLSHFLRNIQV